MKKINLSIIALVFFIAFAGMAQGAELFTPPLPATSLDGDNAGQCVATNVSDKTMEITVQGFNSEGLIVASQTLTVDPYMTRGFSLPEANATQGPVVFCKFAFKGKATQFRAAINVLDGGGDGIISSLEAR